MKTAIQTKGTTDHKGAKKKKTEQPRGNEAGVLGRGRRGGGGEEGQKRNVEREMEGEDCGGNERKEDGGEGGEEGGNGE